MVFHGTASFGHFSCFIIEFFGLPQRPKTSRLNSLLPDLHPICLEVNRGKGLDVSCLGACSGGSFRGGDACLGLLYFTVFMSLFSCTCMFN